jgi:pimeloyl-ACP methyl ester carboxylesterase
MMRISLTRSHISLGAASLMFLTLRAPTIFAQNDSTVTSYPPPIGRLVDIGARRLHLYSQGSGSPAVIIENGNSAVSVDWALVQPEIAKMTRICTYDRAGNAWSDKGSANGSVQQTVDDLHLLLRKAGIHPPYVLVGASIGSLYTLAYQRRYPEEVVGLVLDDPAGDEGLRYLVNGKDMPIYEMTGADMRSAFKPFLKNPPQYQAPTKIEEPFDRLPANLQSVHLWAEKKFFAEKDIINDLITADSWREEFIALRRERLGSTHPLGDIPLILLGRNQSDRERRQGELQAMTALSSAGKLTIAENSGHEIHLYRPDVVIQSILDVLRDARSK